MSIKKYRYGDYSYMLLDTFCDMPNGANSTTKEACYEVWLCKESGDIGSIGRHVFTVLKKNSSLKDIRKSVEYIIKENSMVETLESIIKKPDENKQSNNAGGNETINDFLANAFSIAIPIGTFPIQEMPGSDTSGKEDDGEDREQAKENIADSIRCMVKEIIYHELDEGKTLSEAITYTDEILNLAMTRIAIDEEKMKK